MVAFQIHSAGCDGGISTSLARSAVFSLTGEEKQPFTSLPASTLGQLKPYSIKIYKLTCMGNQKSATSKKNKMKIDKNY